MGITSPGIWQCLLHAGDCSYMTHHAVEETQGLKEKNKVDSVDVSEAYHAKLTRFSSPPRDKRLGG